MYFQSKAIIADMDGVVFKHPKLLKMVSERAVGFVKKRINPYMKDRKAKQINEVLYKNFGHTVLGLREIYDSTVTIKDFCDYVYDRDFIASMSSIKKDDQYYEHQIEVKNMINRIKAQHQEFYIFSNATVEWCQGALDMMDIPLEKNYIIGCNTEIHGKNMCLKPEKHSYTKMMECVHENTGYDYKTQLVFIDDQFANLTPVMSNPYWKTIWYTPDKEQPFYTDKIYSIKDLNQLHLLL